MGNTHDVKVCCSGKCRGRGSDRVFGALEREEPTDFTIEKTNDCFGYCGMGPNVAVDGKILHQMHPDNAVQRVRDEIIYPSPKVHGLGSKGFDELDELLDNL